MIQHELKQFGKLVLSLHVLGMDEEKLVDKALVVAVAVAELAALRAETKKESPWRLSRRRALETQAEAALPTEWATWGSWATRDPILSVLETPVPIIEALGPPRRISPKVAKELAVRQAYLDVRRETEV